MDTIVYTNLSPELATRWEQEWLAREAYKLARKRTQECIMKESKVKDFKDEMSEVLNGLESAGESKPQEPITLEEPLTLEDSIKSEFQDWLEEIEDGLTSDGYTDVKVDGFTNHRVDGTGLNRIEGQYSIEWRGEANSPEIGVKRNRWNEADIKLTNDTGFEKDMRESLEKRVSKLGEENTVISSGIDMHQEDLGHGRHKLWTVHTVTWEEPGATWEENHVVVTEEMRKIILKRMRSGTSWSPNHGDS